MATLRVMAHDVELHVEVDGEGPALVVVNGAALTTRQWDGVIERLAAEHTVVRHDVPRSTPIACGGSC